MEAEINYKGKTIEELKKMSLRDFAQITTSRARRTLLRDGNSQFYQRFETDKKMNNKIRTHRRDSIVTPKMVGKKVEVYNGKEFVPIDIQIEMLGHYLGEFAFTRKKVKHGKAGIGATKSSTAISERK